MPKARLPPVAAPRSVIEPRALLGPAHQETVSAVNNLAVVRYRMRDLKAAEAAMREAVPGFELVLGQELGDQGQYAEADSALGDAVVAVTEISAYY